MAQPLAPFTGPPGPDPAFSAAPPYRCLTNAYVDGAKGSDTNPGTADRPWKTLQNADNGYPNTPGAGECVNVLPGVYHLTRTLILGHGGDSNTAGGYVVYRSTVPQAAQLTAEPALAAGGNGDLIMLWAPYIVIDGFTIDGNHHATQGSGIDGCANGGAPGNIAHHFIAMNNVIHDMGGAGLNSCTADFVAWQHNEIYNTSQTSTYQVSGIDIWAPKALPPGSYNPSAWDAVKFGLLVAYNIVHDNAEGPAIPAPHTDGNGIIIDTTLGSAKCPHCGTPYPGKVLVLGNLAYRNGGGGIHVFLSANVTVANNTVYRNYLDLLNPATSRGELSNGASTGVDWINNIALAVPGAGVLARATPCVAAPFGAFAASGEWTRNICAGATLDSLSRRAIDPAANLIGTNPELTAPADGNFMLRPASPAMHGGIPLDYIASPKPDIGAY
jgi:parallel beta-helix repeat protein